jgi:hypothetical protein
MSYAPATCWSITLSLLVAAMKLTVSPRALNKPWSSATKKPAESTAGTTATFRTGFSTWGAAGAPPPEQPAASAVATAVTSSALPRPPPGSHRANLPGGQHKTGDPAYSGELP